MQDFININYLKSGNARQQKAYRALTNLKIFEHLKSYSPILTGTIPIEIDLPESDLDIICYCTNHEKFSTKLTQLFGKQNGFHIITDTYNGLEATVTTFRYQGFDFEIFGQNIPTTKQSAYRHMLIEHKILTQKDAAFKAAIIKLKESGMKTEPAFAKLLGLCGNPYEALFTLE